MLKSLGKGIGWTVGIAMGAAIVVAGAVGLGAWGVKEAGEAIDNELDVSSAVIEQRKGDISEFGGRVTDYVQRWVEPDGADTSSHFNSGADAPMTAEESRRIICEAIENPSEELNCP